MGWRSSGAGGRAWRRFRGAAERQDSCRARGSATAAEFRACRPLATLPRPPRGGCALVCPVVSALARGQAFASPKGDGGDHDRGDEAASQAGGKLRIPSRWWSHAHSGGSGRPQRRKRRPQARPPAPAIRRRTPTAGPRRREWSGKPGSFRLRSHRLSADGRTLYYGAQQMEANIWMVRQPKSLLPDPQADDLIPPSEVEPAVAQNRGVPGGKDQPRAFGVCGDGSLGPGVVACRAGAEV